MWIIGSLMLLRAIVGVVSAFDDMAPGSHLTGPSTDPSAVSTPGPVH